MLTSLEREQVNYHLKEPPPLLSGVKVQSRSTGLSYQSLKPVSVSGKKMLFGHKILSMCVFHSKKKEKKNTSYTYSLRTTLLPVLLIGEAMTGKCQQGGEQQRWAERRELWGLRPR